MEWKHGPHSANQAPAASAAYPEKTEQAHTSLKLMSAPLQVHDFDLQGIWSLDSVFIFLKLQLDIPALNLRAQLNHRSHNMSSDPTTRGKKESAGGGKKKNVQGGGRENSK